jgi:hypothetical protein
LAVRSGIDNRRRLTMLDTKLAGRIEMVEDGVAAVVDGQVAALWDPLLLRVSATHQIKG